jgi:hypothetical protein
VPDPAEEEPEMSEQVAERVQEMRTVKVWFGEHVIASYCAAPDLAARYAEAMDKRFAGLKITNEPVSKPGRPDLPGEQLWGTPPV